MTPVARTHFASMMLLLATAAWAMSFSLGKDAGERLNELAGTGQGAFFGPVALQGLRFCSAAVLWFAVLPMARHGWTKIAAWRGGYAGVLLGLGIILQHLALDRTTPAATAFLTSLTILWVPLMVCVAKRQLPSKALLAGVGLAGVGLYLMLGEGLTSFRAGEMLGLGCSVVFAFHLIAVSHVVKKDDPWRMCGAQFLVCGVMCIVPALVWGQVGIGRAVGMVADPAVGWRLGVILLFPTFLAFGLMNYFQHRVDATRAVIIYMGESVMAAGFDWLLTGRGLGKVELLGAGLIVAANALAELIPATKAEAAEKTDVMESPTVD